MSWPPKFATVVFLSQIACGLATADTFYPEQIAFFENKVRPVLAENCYGCHGPKKQTNGLRLDSRAAIIKGGEYGLVVTPGNPEGSKLIHAIRQDQPGQTEAMPKDGKKLDQEVINHFTEWVKQGLPWPEEAPPATMTGSIDPKKHWAFQPVVNPPVPEVTAKDRVARPMDAFVIQKLEEKGMSLSPKTDRITRMRRLQIDLLGYPPSFEEVREFANDKAPDAYIRLVDRLLASPHFGERWGRYWLDIARYADTKGYVFQEDRLYPYSYTYRDWVIRSLNQDLPYDQFLKMQIAADQIEVPEKKDNLAALGFITLGRRFLNVEPDVIDDRLDVIFRGTQAMTIGCARCHDHKFDPIPTADYYSVYGVLASSMEPKELPELTIKERTPEIEAFEKELAVKSNKIEEYKQQRMAALYQQETLEKYLTAALESRDKKDAELRQFAQERGLYLNVLQRWRGLLEKGNDSIFGVWKSLATVPAPEFAAKAKSMLDAPDAPQKFSPVVLQEMKSKVPANGGEMVKAYARLFSQASPMGIACKPEFEPFKAVLQSPEGIASIKVDDIVQFFTRPEREKINEIKQDIEHFRATAAAAPPRAMAMVDKPQPVEPEVFIRGNAGRPGPKVPRQFLQVLSGPDRKPFTKGSGRLELAEMIASKSNPLTARVFVNRVWAHLFGEPMIDTPSDYGVRTKAPANPALLEHLSARFMEQNWSLKSLIKEIVLSSTYQQTSAFRPECAEKDPDNALQWRMNRKRMDFEALRDSLLVAAGNVDFRMFGKAVNLFDAPYPKRRSIYGFIDRQNLPGTFRTFDFANPDSHSPKRFETSVPQQALYMLNNPFVQEQAKALCSVVSAGASPEEKARTMIRRVFSREALDTEVKNSVEFVKNRMGSPQTGKAWSYGYGRWDDAVKTVEFTPFPYYGQNRWSGSDKIPDAKLAFANIGGANGHPGNNPKTAVIRRWHAFDSASVNLSGNVKLAAKESRGIRAQIVSSKSGLLGEWKIAPASSIDVGVPKLNVTPGEIIDFILDCDGDDNSDSFTWNPVIKDLANGNVVANSEKDLSGPAGSDAWAEFAQALLCANEFVFVD